MSVLVANHYSTIVRPIADTDLHQALRLLDTARRRHLRIPAASLPTRIKAGPGFLAEDRTGLGGFLLLEAQPPDLAMVVAAALRDTWGGSAYLDLLLPEVEQLARNRGISTLACIGYDAWLTTGLEERGFEIGEWVVNFERYGDWPRSVVGIPAQVRTAHINDLPAIMALDSLAFGQLWRKSAGNFSEALARAISFVVAEINGQIIGYEWCEIHHHHAHLSRLAVHPAYQGQGIGAQLLYQAIIDSLARGVKLMTLNTQENNHRSHALYKRFGFVQTDQRVPVLCKALGQGEVYA